MATMRTLTALLALLSLPAIAEEQTGAEVYQTICSTCHASGVDQAPVFGDTRRWQKLIREGLDELVPAALAGQRKMPPKGGNPALSDREVARGVIHMTNAAGARFAEPSDAQLARWRRAADKRSRK
jgi:cytochrome c5